MKNYLIGIFCMVSSICFGQSNRDSLQKVLLIDSLQLSNESIAGIVQLQKEFIISCSRIAAENSKSIELIELEINTLRSSHIQQMKKLLGSVKYEEYISLIESRMKRRKASGKPLTDN